jgi:hypothetical protein
MTTVEVQVKRVMTGKEATTLVGSPVPSAAAAQVLPSPVDAGHVTVVNDAESGETVALITRLDPTWTGLLRQAVTGVKMSTVARARHAGMQRAQGRTFGYRPKVVIAKREGCGQASSAADDPRAEKILSDLSALLAEQFREMMPERAASDEAIVRQVRDDWFLDEKSLWTSGVINRSATLPYHRDGSNFHTWSAMPTLRYKTTGGFLHLPEYDMAFPCRDGEVTWFCGRDLVHGVTPMRATTRNGYRFSIVYYALRGMKDCRTYAEETALTKERRTERERRMAADLAAGVNDPRAHLTGVYKSHGFGKAP